MNNDDDEIFPPATDVLIEPPEVAPIINKQEQQEPEIEPDLGPFGNGEYLGDPSEEFATASRVKPSAVALTSDKLPPPATKPPLDFATMMKFDANDDPDSLIGRRYLCRGGSALWVGSSGLGKSVLTIQSAITFALNEPLFGLDPVRPLKSVIMSAEDDEGDISETVQGVLRGMDITEDDPRFKVCVENVLIFRENTLKGLPFIGYCERIVKEYKADLIWINPLLSYFTGNPSDPEKSAEFTGALSNMQNNTGVCSQLIHHTGKPKDSKTVSGWSVDDFSYIGLGSSVWTNWARAIIVLQSLKEPPGIFVLRFAKRGGRAGIVDDDLNKVREIYLEQSQIGLRWILSNFVPEGKKQGRGRPTKASWPKVNAEWDGTGQNSSEMKALLRGILSISDKSASRILSDWSGIYIVKDTNDLWIKAEPDGQNGQNGQKEF